MIARHTKISDLLRILNLAKAASHLGSEKAENHILPSSLAS